MSDDDIFIENDTDDQLAIDLRSAQEISDTQKQAYERSLENYISAQCWLSLIKEEMARRERAKGKS